jgi:hypothetical protein
MVSKPVSIKRDGYDQHFFQACWSTMTHGKNPTPKRFLDLFLQNPSTHVLDYFHFKQNRIENVGIFSRFTHSSTVFTDFPEE